LGHGFLEAGGAHQAAYEVLRARSLGEDDAPGVHPALRQRWQSLGMLGLLSDKEIVACGAELSRQVVLEEAPARAGAWRILGEGYAILIERGVENDLNRAATGKSAATRSDIRTGVVAASAAAGDHRLAGV
jgi:hypothetical protein